MERVKSILFTRGEIEAEKIGERIDFGPEISITELPATLFFYKIRYDGATAHLRVQFLLRFSGKEREVLGESSYINNDIYRKKNERENGPWIWAVKM